MAKRKDRATQIGQLRKHCSQLRTRYAFGKTCQNLPPLDSIRASDRVEIIRAVLDEQARRKNRSTRRSTSAMSMSATEKVPARHLLPAAGPALRPAKRTCAREPPARIISQLNCVLGTIYLKEFIADRMDRPPSARRTTSIQEHARIRARESKVAPEMVSPLR